MMEKATILVVEDDMHAGEGVAEILRTAGYVVELAHDAAMARARADEFRPDLLLSDIRLPDADGRVLAVEMKRAHPDLGVILMTAYGSIRDAVEAMKQGVDSYLTKPLDFDELRLAVARLFEKRMMNEENRRLKAEVGSRYGFENLIGGSEVWLRAVEQAANAAATDAPVLLLGESGTGKELVAHAIHRASGRSAGPFIAINCAAIPKDLLENELFGHEAGAFTGATKRRIGRLESADGGTLLLDEIGDMPLELQVKLLRVIERKSFERLGGNAPVTSDFRVIATTHRNLAQMVKNGTFRKDLYYRLGVLILTLPPLRERCGDSAMLFDFFMRRLATKRGAPPPLVMPEALEAMETHDWPGNVRELENFTERVFVTAAGREISREVVALALDPMSELMRPDARELSPTSEPPAADSPPSAHEDLPSAVRALEIEMIRETLKRAGGNRTDAARALGISLRSLHYKLISYKI